MKVELESSPSLIQRLFPFSTKKFTQTMKEKSVSFPSNPSTDTQIGVKLALRSWQAWEYLRFLSISDVRKTSWGARARYDKASVSTTLISKMPSHWDCQSPRISKSATSAPCSSSPASFTTGSHLTGFHTREAKSPTASRTLLCLQVTRPPYQQSRAWSTVKVAPQPSHVPGRFRKACGSARPRRP